MRRNFTRQISHVALTLCNGKFTFWYQPTRFYLAWKLGKIFAITEFFFARNLFYLIWIDLIFLFCLSSFRFERNTLIDFSLTLFYFIFFLNSNNRTKNSFPRVLMKFVFTVVPPRFRSWTKLRATNRRNGIFNFVYCLVCLTHCDCVWQCASVVVSVDTLLPSTSTFNWFWQENEVRFFM